MEITPRSDSATACAPLNCHVLKGIDNVALPPLPVYPAFSPINSESAQDCLFGPELVL